MSLAVIFYSSDLCMCFFICPETVGEIVFANIYSHTRI